MAEGWVPTVGEAVVYRPGPGPAEDGVVTSVHALDRGLVHVRYADQHPGADGKATPLQMLAPLSGGRRG